MTTTKRPVLDLALLDPREQMLVGIYNDEDPDNPIIENRNVPIERSGVGCTPMLEPVPRFRRAPCEQVLSNRHSQERNTWIVLGRDRHGSMVGAGYGANGDTQAGMIDIVVGRGGSKPDSSKQTHPAFHGKDSDCARIYISQKADIDKYFNLTAGGVGPAEATSAIGLKADDIRVVSRQGIKLVTGVDTHNSKDVKLTSTYGIDLIAGNDDDDLQPLVKGDNLVECLIKVIEEIDQLNGVVDQLSKVVAKINSAALSHTHISPFFGSPTSPSVSYAASGGIGSAVRNIAVVQGSIQTQKTNLMKLQNNFLHIQGGDGTQATKKCIVSRFNKTN